MQISRTMIASVAAGAVGSGAGIVIGIGIDGIRGSEDVKAPPTERLINGGLALGTAATIGAAVAGVRSFRGRGVVLPALTLLGPLGIGASAIAAGLGADRYNTRNSGVNELERPAFEAAHHHRLTSYPPIAAVASSVVGAGLAARITGSARTSLIVGLIGVPAGGLGGVLLAASNTSGGERTPYQISTDDPARIAKALFDAAAPTGAAVPVDTSAAWLPVAQATRGVETVRFSALADALGNRDGALDLADVDNHVKRFDVNADGAIDRAEWEQLRAAVLE